MVDCDFLAGLTNLYLINIQWKASTVNFMGLMGLGQETKSLILMKS